MERSKLADLIVTELGDPRVTSLRLERRGRKTIMQTFYVDMDLSDFVKCDH